MAVPTITFDGNAIFGAAVTRTREGPRGEHLLQMSRIDPFDPTSVAPGPIELDVHVEGRMHAASRASLVESIEAVHALLTHPPTPGTLDDGQGREWEGMSFVRFEALGPIDVGRKASVEFAALFRRFAV